MDWYEMTKILSGPFSQKQNPNPFKPFDEPEIDLLEKNEVKVKRPSMWNIVVYNDDYTPIDFVEFVLKTVFHISTLDTLALTLAPASLSHQCLPCALLHGSTAGRSQPPAATLT